MESKFKKPYLNAIRFKPWPNTLKCINCESSSHNDNNKLMKIVVLLIIIFLSCQKIRIKIHMSKLKI